MRMQRCTLKAVSEYSEKQSPARAQVYPLERTCNEGIRSSVNYPARAYCKSTGWVKSPLDRRSTPARSWDTCLRLSAQSSARADCKTEQRNTGCLDSTLERQFPRSSGSAKSGNSRLHLQAKNQVPKHQNRSSWVEFPENTCKHIE